MSSDWPLVPLGELVDFRTGKLDSNAAVENAEYPFFTCSPTTLSIDNYAFDTEAVLLAGNNANGIFPVKYYYGKFNAYQRTYVIEPKDRGILSTKWLYFRIKHVTNELQQMSIGSATKFLTKKILDAYTIPLPPIASQEYQSKILWDIQNKIDLNSGINQTLEQIAQALFKSWFVDFDPVKAKIEVLEAGGSEEEALIAAMQVISSKNAEELAAFEVEKPEEYAQLRATAELFPAAMVGSELGEIPEGWGVSSLHEIVDIIYGAPFKSKQFNDLGQGKPLIRIRDLRNERSNLYTEEEHPRGYLVQNGDLLVGMDGEFKPYIWGGGPAWMNQRICCSKPKDNYSTGLIKEIITPLLRQIELTATATTVIHLGKGDIDKFEFIDAGSELLTCFSQVVDNLTQKVVKGKDSNRTLEQLRDTLLPKLLSGELDVSELVDSLEAEA